MKYNTLASEQSLKKTVESLKANGMNAIVANTADEAKAKVLELVPKQAEVMTMTSVTNDAIGVSEVINNSGDYDSIRTKLTAMNRETQSGEMQKLGAAPMWAIGSVHAVTQDGHVHIASNSGSQIPAYVYGSQHIIWVVGTQKIVANDQEATKRIYEYVLPLESDRVHRVYGMDKSNVSKLLVINKEVSPGRITIIFVKEVLGF